MERRLKKIGLSTSMYREMGISRIPPATVPPSEIVRIGPKTPQYPDGYWRQYDGDGHPVDPKTGKYPDNVSSEQVKSQTHVPLPPGSNLPPGPYNP